MSITTTTVSQAEQLYASLNPAAPEKLSVIDEAQNRFLTLLTTQLKNQDPLNPLDNAQLTSQLAQISTVNGIEKLNAMLQKLLAGLQETQTLEAAALVNHGVLAPGTMLTLGANGALGGFELASPADEVTVTIKDAQGLVVRTLNLGAQAAGVTAFVWDGKSDAGAEAAPGRYSFSLSAKRGSENVTATALAYGLVQAVSRGRQGLSLDAGPLGEISFSDVKQIF
jgi:flagellar basal-body rod modification protein FlgD